MSSLFSILLEAARLVVAVVKFLYAFYEELLSFIHQEIDHLEDRKAAREE